jgi:hypothetical protein
MPSSAGGLTGPVTFGKPGEFASTLAPTTSAGIPQDYLLSRCRSIGNVALTCILRSTSRYHVLDSPDNLVRLCVSSVYCPAHEGCGLGWVLGTLPSLRESRSQSIAKGRIPMSLADEGRRFELRVREAPEIVGIDPWS